MPQAESVAIPKRWPLIIEPQNRDQTTDKDAKLVNCYVELQKLPTGPESWIYKRPGLLEQSRPSGGNATGLGVYNWKGNIYSVFGNKLYKDGVALAGTVDITGGVYSFSSCLGATPRLLLNNGVFGYYYDSGGGLVQIVDPDFPAAFVKGWAYLDGTIYIMKANSHILGSGINDPAAWDPLNDILAQIEPDQGVTISKQLVYVLAFKEWSTEVFYDAGNPTASPLGAVQGAKANFGMNHAGSLQDIDGAAIWIGSGRDAGAQVLKMESLKVEVVSTKPIERLLQQISYATIFSWQLSMDGHRFYGLTSKVSNLTLVYDLDEQLWAQWTDASGNYFPIVSSTYDTSQRPILQHESNGRLYYASSSYLTDDSSVIISDIITPNFDAGVSSRRKTLTREFYLGDVVAGSTLQVRVNDNDYNPGSWSAPRTVYMSQKTPYLDNCGYFYRRAKWIRHACNTRMRLKAIEMQMDIGTL